MPPAFPAIERYEIQEIIGRGAMGVVYRARDPIIGRVVALKTLVLPDALQPTQRHDTLVRFSREARAAGILSHPNIVTVYDVVEGDGEDSSAWIAMEYVEGRTLRDMVPHGEMRQPWEIIEIAMQVARALDYAHRRGIVHRDVKPANILIRTDGLVKLADFGVARCEASELTRSGQSVGSPSYIAPEILQDQPADGRADLYSFGVILYELVTGAKPFKGSTLSALYNSILNGTPPPPSTYNKEISPDWDAVIMRLLARRPQDRYPDASYLIEDLRCLERGLPPRCATSAEAEGSQGDATALLPTVEILPESYLEEVMDKADQSQSGTLWTFTAHHKALAALVTVAGFGLLVSVGAALLRSGPSARFAGSAASAAAQPGAIEPGSVTLSVEHNLKQGRLVVAMDGKTLVSTKLAKEGVRRKLEIPAGMHSFTVTLDGGSGKTWSGVVTRNIKPQSSATLQATLDGMLRRKLELSWK